MQKRIFQIVDKIISTLEHDKFSLFILITILTGMILVAIGLSQTKASYMSHTVKNTKQVSYFQEVSKNFRKSDEVRIEYIAYILKQNWYCKWKFCKKIWLVWNAVIKAEWWDKTIYGTRIYNNPFHIKYCMSKWYKMWLVKKQWKFCVFKNYKSSIIAWWRLWRSQGYNSTSIRTAIRYTWWDNAKHWLRIIQYYKNKFNYLIK